jgi:hypothetical protein
MDNLKSLEVSASSNRQRWVAARCGCGKKACPSKCELEAVVMAFAYHGFSVDSNGCLCCHECSDFDTAVPREFEVIVATVLLGNVDLFKTSQRGRFTKAEYVLNISSVTSCLPCSQTSCKSLCSASCLFFGTKV